MLMHYNYNTITIRLQCNYDTITIQVQYQHNVGQAWETESAAWRAGTGLYEYANLIRYPLFLETSDRANVRFDEHATRLCQFGTDEKNTQTDSHQSLKELLLLVTKIWYQEDCTI